MTEPARTKTQIKMRIPVALHSELTKLAKREGVSLTVVLTRACQSFIDKDRAK